MAGFAPKVVCVGLLLFVVYGSAVPTKTKPDSEKSLTSAQKVEILKEQLEELQKTLYKLSDTIPEEEEAATETPPTQPPEKPVTKPPARPSEEQEARNFIDSVAASLEQPRERERGPGDEITREDVQFLKQLKNFFKKKTAQMVEVEETKSTSAVDPDLAELANILTSNTRGAQDTGLQEMADTRTVVETIPEDTEFIMEGGTFMGRPYRIDELGDPNDVSKKETKLSEEEEEKKTEAIADRLQEDLREASREGITLEQLLQQMRENTERLNKESRRQALELQSDREPRAQNREERLIELVEGRLKSDYM